MQKQLSQINKYFFTLIRKNSRFLLFLFISYTCTTIKNKFNPFFFFFHISELPSIPVERSDNGVIENNDDVTVIAVGPEDDVNVPVTGGNRQLSEVNSSHEGHDEISQVNGSHDENDALDNKEGETEIQEPLDDIEKPQSFCWWFLLGC